MISRWIVAGCLGLIAGVSWGQLEIVMDSRMTLPDGQTMEDTSRMWLGDEHLSVQMQQGAAMGINRIIYRGDRDAIWMVQDSLRSYKVMDRAAIEALADQVNAAQRQMEEALARMPPEQREMMRNMMPAQMSAKAQAPARDLRRTAERREISGFPCVKYEVHSEGRLVRELWVASWSDLGHRESAFAAAKKMADLQKKMLESVYQGVPGAMGADPFVEFDQVDGFPIYIRHYEDGRLTGEITVQSISRKDLGPDAFDVPAGYRAEPLIPQGAAPRF